MRPPLRRILSWFFVVILGLAGVQQIGQGGYIKAKAIVAQYLLQQAWAETLGGAQRVAPWSWADTWPVARLEVKRLGVDQIVLAGASGRTLAFGPAHVAGTAGMGGNDNSVLSGHRDTHFEFLRYLKAGDAIELTLPDGARKTYWVQGKGVYDQDDTWLLSQQGVPQLTLITCYPFDTLVPGGPQRFVVTAWLDRPATGREVIQSTSEAVAMNGLL